MANTRDSGAWLRDLRSQGVEHESALADFHMRLLEDLPRGLSKWLPPEHPGFEFIIEYTVQVSLARVLNQLDTYEGRSQFINWVDKIAVRISLNEWRRLRWRDIALGVAEYESSNDRASNRFVVSNRSPASVAKPGDLRQRLQPILSKN
jgi:DNA-directed RNA polymerase specialized sigma24 family protein